MTVFKIVHEQSLIVDEHDQIVEVRPWTHIELGYEAIQRGWLKKFGPNWLDLGVLLAIGLHARPLRGDDFELLKDLGLAQPQDKDRLYARITDVGLAAVLGCNRHTVSGAAARLAEHQLLRTMQLPKNFRDSRGLFAGTEAFLLSGQTLVQSTRPSDLAGKSIEIRGGLAATVKNNGGSLAATVGLHRGSPAAIKVIPTSITLTSVSGADAPSSNFSELDSEPDASTVIGRDPDRGLAGSTYTSDRAHGATAGEASSAAGHRLIAELNQALADPKAAEAFETLLTAAHALNDGLTEAGLRVAAIMLLPLPERRRKVLNDLRKMRGSQVKPARQRHFIVGILGQHIGVLLGLGLDAEGRVRCVPTKDDYAAIGALADEYGAETLWLTTCLVAGQAIEGDPLNYLRAALRHKHERDHSGAAVGAGMGRFDQLDYAADQTG
jgi:hypothetical protein